MPKRAVSKKSSNKQLFGNDDLTMSIKDLGDLQRLVENFTLRRFRPRFGSKSQGSKNLLEDEEIKADVEKKVVRFDESSNQLHHIPKESNERWYSSTDYQIFAQRVRYRVEKSCESEIIKEKIMVLERAHLGCMNYSGEDEVEHEEIPGGVTRTELAELYQQIDNLVGLEPYIAEYMPHWHDRSDRHQGILNQVLAGQHPGEKRAKPRRFLLRKPRKCPVDEKSRRFSLGSRLYAREIAHASFTSSELSKEQ